MELGEKGTVYTGETIQTDIERGGQTTAQRPDAINKVLLKHTNLPYDCFVLRWQS